MSDEMRCPFVPQHSVTCTAFSKCQNCGFNPDVKAERLERLRNKNAASEAGTSEDGESNAI